MLLTADGEPKRANLGLGERVSEAELNRATLSPDNRTTAKILLLLTAEIEPQERSMPDFGAPGVGSSGAHDTGADVAAAEDGEAQDAGPPASP